MCMCRHAMLYRSCARIILGVCIFEKRNILNTRRNVPLPGCRQLRRGVGKALYAYQLLLGYDYFREEPVTLAAVSN